MRNPSIANLIFRRHISQLPRTASLVPDVGSGNPRGPAESQQQDSSRRSLYRRNETVSLLRTRAFSHLHNTAIFRCSGTVVRPLIADLRARSWSRYQHRTLIPGSGITCQQYLVTTVRERYFRSFGIEVGAVASSWIWTSTLHFGAFFVVDGLEVDDFETFVWVMLRWS